MSDLSELGQILHEEHFRILMLICALENRVNGAAGAVPLDPAVKAERQQLDSLVTALDQIVGHNAFEETILFPLICDCGEQELATLLTHEHVTIGPMAKRLRTAALTLLEQGVNADRWTDFREAAVALVEEMMAHLQKEEVSIIQRLGTLLDADTDHRLAQTHSACVIRRFNPAFDADPERPSLTPAA